MVRNSPLRVQPEEGLSQGGNGLQAGGITTDPVKGPSGSAWVRNFLRWFACLPSAVRKLSTGLVSAGSFVCRPAHSEGESFALPAYLFPSKAIETSVEFFTRTHTASLKNSCASGHFPGSLLTEPFLPHCDSFLTALRTARVLHQHHRACFW